jgi:hypothetical protein
VRRELAGLRLYNKTETEIQDLHRKITGKDRKSYVPMKRPDSGKTGRKVDLITNWFEVGYATHSICQT